MFIVQTTNGVVFTGAYGNVGKKEGWPGDEATAKSVCSQANAKAEKLGIRTRYEVTEVAE